MSEFVQPDAAEAQEADNTVPGTETPDSAESASESLTEADAPSDVFPRDYVEALRRENQTYRQKAKDAEQSAADANVYAESFARRLHTLMVAQTGRLADPTDLPFQVEHLMDAAALAAAIDELLADKPHFAAPKKPAGDVGQGKRSSVNPLSILDVLRSNA